MQHLGLMQHRMNDSAVDAGLSSALLHRVATGDAGPTLRLFAPTRSVAFGALDAAQETYPEAIAAVRATGFDAVRRLAGGKAAVFHEATVAFAWTLPHTDPKLAVESRFESIASIVVDALSRLGRTGQVGEVPGEYCPGRYSVHVDGHKVMGVGQRLIKGAAHVGGVVVADRADLVNAALTPAYAALGYDWRPEATGAIGVELEDAIEALIASFDSAGYHLEDVEPDESLVLEATDLARRHRPPIA